VPARNVRLEATLLSDSTPVPGKTICFYHRVTGETQWILDGDDDTDQNGVATLTVQLTVPQTYDFKAEFEGDEDYEASVATVLGYRVKAKTSLTLTVTPL